MKKIIIFESLSKKYVNLRNKVRQNYKLISMLKLMTVLFILLLSMGAYGYFVNISSTKGYFLRQEMRNLEDAKFNDSIVQLEILKIERQMWDKLETQIAIKQKKLEINEKVVYIEGKQLLTYKK